MAPAAAAAAADAADAAAAVLNHYQKIVVDIFPSL
jgi:hypothetical protein